MATTRYHLYSEYPRTYCGIETYNTSGRAGHRDSLTAHANRCRRCWALWQAEHERTQSRAARRP